MNNPRSLPAVDSLLQHRQAAELISGFGRSLTLSAIRDELAELRTKMLAGEEITQPKSEAILESVKKRIQAQLQPTLVPVINATGVVLHTNLGRAPLGKEDLIKVTSILGSYNTLEFNLASGKRGSRSSHAENLIRLLTGAEAALVVNNNAAAVLLSLTALARRKRVIISRTQLVEIGGGFRVPDVMRQSGARLVEIGTTNRVNLRDYQDAMAEPTGLVLRAHHSNFKLVGFTHEPELSDIVEIAHQQDVAVMDDIGSGAFLDTTLYGLGHEPTVQESLAAGVDLVCFSGDKLLGGPQAGILVGKAKLIEKIKKHPLARAVRADKFCLAALQVVLEHYLKEDAENSIPIWRMLSTPLKQIENRAEYWRDELGAGEVIEGYSTVGGGSLPEETLPTYLLAISPRKSLAFLNALRKMSPPIIARIESDRVLFDPRTVLPEQDGALLVGIENALAL
jgi:L-seryl-tRNA(Ser) seleniumtransferase